MIRRLFNILAVGVLVFVAVGLTHVEARIGATIQIQLVHLAPSVGTVDVYVNNKPFVQALAYQSVSDPLPVTDTSLKLAIVATGGKLADATVLTVTLDPPGQLAYVIALAGSTKDGTLTAVVYAGNLSRAQIGSASAGAITISGAYVRATALSAATTVPTADAMGGMSGMAMTPAATAVAMDTMGGMDGMATPAATMAAMGGMDMSGPTSAVYMTIANSSDKADKLLFISTDAAQSAAVHETIVTNNIAQMQPVQGGLDVPASGKVSLRPGSFHIMLTGLTRDLVAGGTIKLTLTFQSGTVINLIVPITQT